MPEDRRSGSGETGRSGSGETGRSGSGETGRSASGETGRSGSGPDRSFRVVWLATVDSTNRSVLDAALAGEPEGLVVVADHQSAGRGRLGRTWDAAPGSSLLLSVLLRPRRTVGELHLCTAAAGLAMADAVHDVGGFTPDLKWPNDLLVEGRKLAGVLAEVDLGSSGAVRAVVVGIGINVGAAAVPPELAATATACEVVAGRAVDRRRLLDAFLGHLGARLDAPDSELVADYRARLATIGARVRVERAAGSVEGIAVDVDDLGALVLETDSGDVLTVSAGDVVHLRPA